jgi:hypothetical protein
LRAETAPASSGGFTDEARNHGGAQQPQDADRNLKSGPANINLLR